MALKGKPLTLADAKQVEYGLVRDGQVPEHCEVLSAPVSDGAGGLSVRVKLPDGRVTRVEW